MSDEVWYRAPKPRAELVASPVVIFVAGKRSRSLPWFGARKPYGMAEQFAEQREWWAVDLGTIETVSYVGRPIAVMVPMGYILLPPRP